MVKMMGQKLGGVFFIGLLQIVVGNVWAEVNDLRLEKVWLGESVPGQNTASLQLNLTSTRTAARLVSVRSPAAERVEMRLLTPSQGKMKARAVSSLRLPRNRAVVFGGGGGGALMLIGLKKSLNVGDIVPVSLTIEFPGNKLRTLEAHAEVKALALSYKHYSGHEIQDHR